METLEQRRLLSANLVISEFLAGNDSSIADSFGNNEDWIEIHNAGDAPANLNDYFLTDNAGNPEKWRFPSQTLAAGGSLVVFASERNIAISGQELHTNFKLDAGGEYLGLIRAADDQPQFEYAPSYPGQSTDVSYGLTDWDNPSSARIYFSVPSPGTVNAPSVATPTFSVAGKTFSTSMQVELSSTTPGAAIYYTTDRSIPTSTSSLYTGAIALTGTTMIRARAIAPGLVDSPVTSQTYIAVDATVNTFRSNLPIVVLESYGAGTSMNDATWINASAQFIDTQSDGYADMLDPADFSGRIGLRYRGSTSWFNYPKKQFAVEVRDENNNDRDASLLGMPSDSDWVLYDPWTEKSLLNNVLAMDWSREMGHYASRVRFVEVYFNANADSSISYTSDYMGVYVLMEKIKRDDNRVNIDKMLPTDAAEPEVTGGYIFKKDRKETQEIAINVPGGAFVGAQQFVMVEPDETELTAAQQTWLTSYLTELDTVMNGPNFADPVNGYAKYIDVDSWVDYWIQVEFAKNVDGFWLSNFMYKDRGGKIKEGPAWDYNLAFGQVDYSDGASASGWSSAFLGVNGSFGEQYGYYKRLMQDPSFVLKVADRWQDLRKSVLSTSKMWSDIDSYVGLLTDHNGNYPVGPTPAQTSNNAAVRNFKRWPVLGTWSTTNSFFDAQGRWIEDVNLLKQWLRARAEWMDAQFIAAPVLSPCGGDFGAAVDVTMTPKGAATYLDTSLMGASYGVQYLVPSATLSGWQNLSYSPTGWTSGTVTTGKGVGYDTTTTPVDYSPLISVNVKTPMQNVRSSIYLRFSINIPNPAAIDHLILKMKYDDGFVAWFNGVRVIEGGLGNANVNPAYNTTAPAERDETLATQYVEFDISEVKSQLVAGTNILAIQGINRSSSNNDVLIVPELFSRTYSSPTAGSVYYTTDGSDPRDPATGNASATAQLYTGAVPISSSRRIKARTLVGGAWSGIADEVYNFDANNLRVTEIMYNPPAPPSGSPYTAQDFEYIEVKNVGASPINLNGYSFSQGIGFTFPNATLAAGAYGVIVKNLAAYQSRYGSGTNVIGTFISGNLDNGGELVAIQNGFAQVTQTFTYDDAWYPQTDGPGYSLVIVSENGALSNWDLASGWRASFAMNGSPGSADVDSTPPALQSVSFDATTKQVRMVFSEDVTVSPGASVLETVSNTTVPPDGTSAAANVITIQLPGALANGIFRVTLPAASVSDLASNHPAASAVFTFGYVEAGQYFATPALGGCYVLDQLSIGAGAGLYLADNDLAVNGGDFAAIRAMVFAGFGGSSGIISAGSGETILAVLDNALVGASDWPIGSGQTIAANCVIGKYTFLGDMNLDGQVTSDDYALLDGSLGTTPPPGLAWLSGDANLDGNVTSDDYAILDSAMGSGSGNPLAPRATTLTLEREIDDVLA